MRLRTLTLVALVSFVGFLGFLGFSGCGNDGGSGAGADAGAGTIGAGGHAGSGSLAGATGAGGAAGGAPMIATGLPPDKKLSDLTPMEVKQACDKVVGTATSGTAKADLCKLTAVLGAASASGGSDAQLRTVCTQRYDACIAAPTADAGADAQCTMLPAMTMCTATVAELESCANAYTGTFHTLAAGLPACGMLTQTAVAGVLAGGALNPAALAQLAACNTLNQKCPGFTQQVMPTGF
jgi:hypothetical protein